MVEFQKPVYALGDVVYLRDSAAIGFIEAYRIQHAVYNSDGTVSYVLETSVRTPTVATFGDMVGPPRYAPLTMLETNLVSYCEAIDLALAHHQVAVSDLQAKKDSHCDDT